MHHAGGEGEAALAVAVGGDAVVQQRAELRERALDLALLAVRRASLQPRNGRAGGECSSSVDLAFELPAGVGGALKLTLLSDAMEGLDRELVVSVVQVAAAD